jgi:hypothetical protein
LTELPVRRYQNVGIDSPTGVPGFTGTPYTSAAAEKACTDALVFSLVRGDGTKFTADTFAVEGLQGTRICMQLNTVNHVIFG